MDDAIGTIFVFSLAGIIFGDEIGRKVAIRMMIASLALAFFISPEFAVALALAPFVMGILIIGGMIAYIRKL